MMGRIFTTRNSSCGKVMFSQVSVILSTGGRGVGMSRGVAGIPKGGRDVIIRKGGVRIPEEGIPEGDMGPGIPTPFY